MAEKKASLILVLGSRITTAVSGIRRVGSEVAGLARQVAKPVMWGGAIGLGAVTAASAVAARAVGKFGAQAEQTRLRFQTMLGSVAKGDAMMAKLDRFSNSTPYSGDEVNRAAGTLLAFGVAAGDVESALRKVGDVAAGSGKDFNELASIYGKVFAKGKMDTQAMNQMVEAGIPIVKMLGQLYGKSGAEIYKMAEQGQITADMVSRAFDKMSGSGGVYADMMTKQSETVSGMWGAVVGQLEYASANFGESLLPLMKEGLAVLQGWADQIVEMSQDGRLVKYFSAAATAAIDVGVTAAKGLNVAWHVARATFTQIGDLAKSVWLGVQSGAMLAFVNICEALNKAGNYVNAAWQTVGRVFRMLFNRISANAAIVFAGIVNIVVGAVNAVIRALNRIPGVDLGLVQKPRFVTQIENYAREAGDKAYRDLQAITSGQDFKDAKTRAEHQNRAEFGGLRKSAEEKGDQAYSLMVEVGRGMENAVAGIKSGNAAIEEFGKTAKDRIAKWADSATAELTRRHNAEKTVTFDKSPKQPQPQAASVRKVDRINVDSLTKIGLYNFGKYSTRSLDKERNSLLRQILDTVSGGQNQQMGAMLT